MIALELSPLEQGLQDYLSTVRQWWSTDLYRAMFDEHTARASKAYEVFCALEGGMQELKYAGPVGLAEVGRRQRARLLVALDQLPDGVARLDRGDGEELPEYYTSVPFHHHPGGTFASPESGFVYEFSSGTTTLMVDQASDMHHRFAREIAALVADVEHPVVVDVGCGFGKSTVALAKAMPNAQVHGLDLSEPLLRLALLRARENGLDIGYRLGFIEKLPYEDDSVDVISASMVVHEVPPETLRAFLSEAGRVLRPGGLLYFLDFYVLPDNDLAEALHRGHSRRNEEPYMEDLFDLDLPAEFEKAGLTGFSARSLPQGGQPEAAWALPWTEIIGRKPAN